MKRNKKEDKNRDENMNDEIINETEIEKEEACETEESTEITAEEPDELTKLNQKCAEYLDKLQRTMADFDNFRKRTIKEKTSMYDDGVRDTIEKLLPIIDNFERAVSAAAAENRTDGFYKGISMIQRQLAGYLDDIGIEAADEPGDKFDPKFHFAVAHIEDDSRGAGEIIEVLQKGYIYKDKVIRASMVKVAN